MERDVEYCLWHVPPDIIPFARELAVEMKVSLGLRANVRKFLEILEIIKLTRFQDLPDS